MTGTTITLHTAAAEALVAVLPTPSPLRAVPADASVVAASRASDVVVTSFVGSISADTALVLADLDQVAAAAGTDSPLVSVVDVLRPALEAATAVLGVGVLGESRREPADALLADPDTVVFALTSAGQPAGWFAVRIRDDASAHGSARASSSPLFDSVASNLGRINDVEMALTVEIGRTRMSVRDVLGLEPGAVVELDRSAGAPADVLLNGRLIAHGEVVVVDQDYAVRITTILDVADGVL